MLAGVKRGPIHYDYEAPEGQTRVSNWIGWRCNLIKMSGITAHHSSTDTSLPGCWNHVWHPKSCALNIKNIAEGIPYLHLKKRCKCSSVPFTMLDLNISFTCLKVLDCLCLHDNENDTKTPSLQTLTWTWPFWMSVYPLRWVASNLRELFFFNKVPMA